MTTAEIHRGLYETVHGARGERGAVVLGGDRMVLCDECAAIAWAFASTYWDDGFMLKVARPFKVELWNPVRIAYACEWCGR